MTKKAKRIMIDTYNACKHEIKVFGYDGVGFSRMGFSTYDIIYKRTMNEMVSILNEWKKENELNRKFNIISEDEYKLECQIYDMIEKTMANQYIA